MAFCFNVPLIVNILSGRTDGLNLATFAIFSFYFIIGFSLALGAFREYPSALRKQTLIVFGVHIGMVLLDFGAGLSAIAWQKSDSIFTAFVFLMTLITVFSYRGFKDPFARGWVSVWCKAFPQLWLAFTMLSNSSEESGISGISIAAGHMTATPRLFQVYLSGRNEGWDRPTSGLIIGEISNVVTWWVVTILWFYLKFNSVQG